MIPPTFVTLTIPLELPLSLVNAIEHEANVVGCSISQLLSMQLIDALQERERDPLNLQMPPELKEPTNGHPNISLTPQVNPDGAAAPR